MTIADGAAELSALTRERSGAQPRGAIRLDAEGRVAGRE